MRLNLFLRLTHQDQGARRTALLKLAIASSALSKICGLALQAIAIPLVYHSLGQHRYELFLLLTAMLATIALAQMGAGPGLTQGIAKANAEGNRDYEASLLSAALRLAIVAAVTGGAVILGIIYLMPSGRLFGAPFIHDRAEILAIANACVFVLIVQIISGVVDSALAGYQEQIFSNIGTMLANLTSIALLILVCRYAPTITRVILVLYGAPTLSRVVNVVLLFVRRPYLIKGISRSNRRDYGVLLYVGLAFWAMQIGSLLEQYGGTFILAHLSTTRATNFFAVVYKSITLAGSAVTMLTQPLWPAFTDAIAHRDTNWIRGSYRTIRRVSTAYSCLVAIVLMTSGRFVFQRLLHIETEGSALFVILGVYFIANIWTHVFYMTMMGMDVIWKVAGVALAENIVMILAGVVLVPHLGASGMGLAYLLASVLLPTWLLPRMMSDAISGISHRQSSATQKA